MHCFESDGDDLEYLTSLMSDDESDNGREDSASSQCSPKTKKPKSRIESGAFDAELDAEAKSRKRRLSRQDTRVHKKKREEQSQQENDNRTAILEGE